ncbi:class I SAM-dependent methyltransferase [Arcanobacterium ihumii]|uniref:class I SAM-dependent methyltransferase n=1 Tax=Arcanobacterium ihumii TaxID=2138162 RepID=UPI000F523532|nr:class I SAM-dependent methyltransferase [Arcanobacterium ihumii]
MKFAGRMPIENCDDPVSANREWWDANASDYIREHGSILGAAEFMWGPEGILESDLQFLGSPTQLKDARILEIGCGAAQCSRHLARKGFNVVASDLSGRMLEQAKSLNSDYEVDFPLVEADAQNLPFDVAQFDVVFTSFGVIPFIDNLLTLHKEVNRVLVPGGLWAFSAIHPVRWMFPDDPTPRGMKVTSSYFGDDPYLERKASGKLEYAEFHHTFADHINALVEANFRIDEVIEPKWPSDRTVVWGGWGPQRSPYIPGTLLVRAFKN